MLVRADPATDSISLLSFPRDMRVEIRCPGQTPFFDKITHAYAYCGPQGSLETVKGLTGVQINYLITVNFRGFRQIVDRLDGVWIDVDRRYFNDRGGPCGYATINLQPGLPAAHGTAGARLRALPAHRLRPVPRRASAAVREGVQGPDAGELRAARAPEGRQRDHEQRRGRAGRRQSTSTGAPSSRTRCSRTACREGACSRRGSRASRASPTSRPTPENITRAVETFTHPDVESSEKATAVALGEKLKQRVPGAARRRRITVLNGNGVTGRRRPPGYLLGQRSLRGRHAAERPSRERADASTTSARRSTSTRSRREARAARRRRSRTSSRSAEVKPLPTDDLAARERRDADRRRRADVPRQPRLGARSTRRRSGSARASCTAPNASIDDLRERRDARRRSRSWFRP